MTEDDLEPTLVGSRPAWAAFPHASPAARRAGAHLVQQIAQHGPVGCQTTDGDQWYPDNGKPTDIVIDVCRACPANAACLDYAIAADERYGVWGGTTPADRLHRGRTGSPELGTTRPATAPFSPQHADVRVHGSTTTRGDHTA